MAVGIINAIITYSSKASYQEKLLSYLREIHFKFIPYEELRGWFEDKLITFEPLEDHANFSFMVRELKPQTKESIGEYDFRLVFAFKLNGKKSRRVHCYHNNQYLKTIKLPWQDKDDINFRKMKITLKFPDELPDYIERRKWRHEHLRVQKNPNFKPSEFYLKWKPFVQILEPDRYYHGAHKRK